MTEKWHGDTDEGEAYF